MKWLVSVIFSGICLIGLHSAAQAYYPLGEPTGFVNDRAQLLSGEEQKALETRLNEFEQETSQEITVVTISSLEGDTIENFAVKLFADWGIGKEQADNGILLLISKEDRVARIEVGYGLEGVLPDASAHLIINDILVKDFKSGEYVKGINDTVTAIMSVLKGEPIQNVPVEKKVGGEQASQGILMVVIFGFIGLLSFGRPSRKRGAVGVVLGAGAGFLLFNTILAALIGAVIFGLFGLFGRSRGGKFRDFGGGSSGGGFGGFGGGSSGGGGASGRW